MSRCALSLAQAALGLAAILACPLPSGGQSQGASNPSPSTPGTARKVLERRGYTVLDASTGADALEISAARDGAIDILVSDVVMPGIGGRELAEQLQRLRPGLPVLLMSGYNEDEILRRGVTGCAMEFIQKPFELDVLASRIRQILDRQEVVA